MVDRRLEKRLRSLGKRLARLREELAIADDQLLHFTDEADDSRLRALVSETAVADREHREAARHADAMLRHREEIRDEIVRLEQQQDELLDALIDKGNAASPLADRDGDVPPGHS